MPSLLRPIFLVLLALPWSAAAEAKVITIDDIYTIDVPADWKMTRPSENYIALISPDEKAVFLITHSLSYDRHKVKVADLVQRYDALRIGGPDRFVTSMIGNDRAKYKRLVATILGDHKDRVPIYRSIQAVAGDKMREQWLGN